MTDFLPAPRGPSDKELKYDRQLRLWAAAGQAALESANVLLVNSSSGTVGVEALKNLVLPGWPPRVKALCAHASNFDYIELTNRVFCRYRAIYHRRRRRRRGRGPRRQLLS